MDLALMFVDNLVIVINITDKYIQSVYTCNDVNLIYNSNKI